MARPSDGGDTARHERYVLRLRVAYVSPVTTHLKSPLYTLHPKKLPMGKQVKCNTIEPRYGTSNLV